MVRISISVAMAVGLGALLGWVGVVSHLPVGWIGALALIAVTGLARRRWARMAATTGAEPGAPERIVWQRMAWTGAVMGQLAVCLLNPQVDMHMGQGNWLAVDNWTLTLGMGVSALLFRNDAKDRDERDDAILALGRRVGFAALILLLLGLVLWMGFAPRNLQTALSHFLLANLLIDFILAAWLAGMAAQLLAYAPDRRTAE